MVVGFFFLRGVLQHHVLSFSYAVFWFLHLQGSDGGSPHVMLKDFSPCFIAGAAGAERTKKGGFRYSIIRFIRKTLISILYVLYKKYEAGIKKAPLFWFFFVLNRSRLLVQKKTPARTISFVFILARPVRYDLQVGPFRRFGSQLQRNCRK